VITLEASKLHWLGEPPEYDTCVHGALTFEIDGHVISDDIEHDWTVSGSALLFLRSLEQGHSPSEVGLQLIPHCAMPDFDLNGELLLSPCGYGIDWEINLERNRVNHRFQDGVSIEVSAREWKTAVVRFANQILEFIKSEPERQFVESDLNDGKPAFELYCAELKTLIERHQHSLLSP